MIGEGEEDSVRRSLVHVVLHPDVGEGKGGALQDRVLPMVVPPFLPPLPGLDLDPGRGEQTLQCRVLTLIKIVDREGKAVTG